MRTTVRRHCLSGGLIVVAILQVRCVEPSGVRQSKVETLPSVAPERTESKKPEWTFHCTTAVRQTNGTFAYGLVRVRYNKKEVRDDGAGQKTQFMLIVNDAAGRQSWAAKCVVPRSVDAMNKALQRLGAKARVGVGATQQSRGSSVHGLSLTTSSSSEPCEVWEWYEDPDLTDGNDSHFICGSLEALVIVAEPSEPDEPPTIPPVPDIVWVDPEWSGGTPPVVPNPTNPEFNVHVSCPSSVVRGTNITCYVDLTFEDAEVTGWKFTPADTAIEEVEDCCPTQWEGQMVTRGWVSVSAEWEDDSDSDTTYVNVTARSWPTTTAMPWNGMKSGAWGAPPYIVSNILSGVLGQNISTTNGSSNAVPDGSYNWQPVSGGPNAGIYWVTSQNISFPRSYQVNQYILGTGSEPADILFRGEFYTRSEVLAFFGDSHGPFIDGITAHETYGGSPGAANVGHQRGLEEAVAASCGNYVPRLESIVGQEQLFHYRMGELIGLANEYLHVGGITHVRVNSLFFGVPTIARTVAVDSAVRLWAQDKLPETAPQDLHRVACDYGRLSV